MLLVSKTFLFTLVQTIMEVYKPRFAIVALLLSAFAIMETTQQTSAEFDAARQKIYHEHINYKKFCSEKPQGEEKIACRIKDIPSVGFLVCQQPTIEGRNCAEIINDEVNNIVKLRNGNVKTVTVSPPSINGVKCGKNSSLNCSGFLEGWIDKKTGQFQQVRDHISNKTVNNLIEQVKSFTKSGLNTTADDLVNITNYMKIDPGKHKFRQICDLQGFFVVDGGFLVGDIPYITGEINETDTCYDGEPTTEEVLTALETMIQAFNPTPTPTPTPNRSQALIPRASILTIIIMAFLFQDFS